MKILITGNMGYVGPAVVDRLRKAYPAATIIGYDSAFFAHCLTAADHVPERPLDEQLFGDVRSLPVELLQGCDAVVHLAAVSNDPMGSRFEQVTHDINEDASVTIARAAAAAGVKNFVFASSCSVYGVAGGEARVESDPLNPMTAYAKSKVGTEKALAEVGGSMVTTCLRFATACGMSPRLRLDLVLNDFVACALSSGEITVLSDGTPWRPLIDTNDMALAISWAVGRKADNGGTYLVVNAGTDKANYQVRDLAEAVVRHVPGTRVSINHSAAVDSRSYKVDFSRYAELAPDHQPRLSLDDSIARLVTGLKSMGFADAQFRQSGMMRLKVLEGHIAAGRLTQSLKWQGAEA
ncbi:MULTISPECIES: NAD-dependent epimerase/dehydratase family protein [unclassified Aureimonas]|uniref:NAD-dependent epimerase/dehydratase family protein n=1 Tax=unclassified Aureimonas TaxID=2615206 RepID=UPI0006F645CE|nr:MULTISPECIES: SDR family oxidoreductase [unclassified Aureimonas]KQT60486.1 NAD-dependent epimerase [Aureimonas sp. Leaf427]KQT79363.1 NAD-dependent epimerase [Aureimonas sp. Leaf460]